jgi:hypothetical protein
MKPPMKNRAVIITEDRTAAPDRYGKYPTKRIDTKARVNFSTQFVRSPQGIEKQARLEVDLPPEIVLSEGLSIEAQDSQEKWHTAQIISIDDATNFAGNRILYRTVFCD